MLCNSNDDDDDVPEIEAVSQTHTHTCSHLLSPVHVQYGATSCADVADDHRGWKDTLSVLRHQRHIDMELLKILQNKTTDRKLFHISSDLKNKITDRKLFHVFIVT